MKGKTSYFVMAVLAISLLAACVATEPETKTGIPDHCIELTIGNIHPGVAVTKATERGDTLYNENLVQSVDCFFYPDGKTDENAVFVALGRGADPVAEGDSTVYKIKVFFTDADAIKMFGSTTSGTCQVYAICNAPLSYGANTSVDVLKELVVENDFSSQTVQESFVMHSEEPETVTLTTESEIRSASGRIHVKRSAAKIQLFLKIPKTFIDEANAEWEPVLDAGVQIMMANGVKRGKVDGSYTVQASDYINTSYRAVDSLAAEYRIAGMEDYKFTHVPFYSYPSTWTDLSDYAASLVFRIPWRIKGSTGSTWKSYQLSPNLVGLKFEPNHYYRTFVTISSLGGADKEETVIITSADYVVLDWMNETAEGGGQGIVPGELVTYKYLVVDNPNITLNNEETAYYTYVSSSPLTSVKITKVEYYDNSQASPKQSITTSTTITEDTQTISNAAGSFTISKSTPGLITMYHSLSGQYSSVKVYATITNEDGATQDITFEQNPSINLVRQAVYGDVFVNGYFAKVAGSSFGGSYTSSGTTYYYSRSATLYSNHNSANGCIILPPDSGYGSVIEGTGSFSGGISTTFYTSIINITSFNDSNNTYKVTGESPYTYRIGDPRVPSSTHYNGADSWNDTDNFRQYLYNESGTTGYTRAWTDPENILITSQNEDDRNIIAPRFIVCSALNAMLTTYSVTFDYAVKRGATYQEAGYPAGRWRLPSEAEVAFIVARQRDGAIPNLFAEGSTYWVGSGRQVYIPTSGDSIEFREVSKTDKQSCRFVYDLWYWGDEPASTGVYHPNGHNTDY